MKIYLITSKGRQPGRVVPIDVDLFLMGSDKVCQLVSKLPGIAPQHCAIIKRDENKVFVQDMGSGQTLLNDELVPPGEDWPVHAGDRIGMGPLEFLVQFHEHDLSPRDAESWAIKCLDKDAERERERERFFDDDSGVDAPHEPRPSADASSAAAAMLDKLQLQRGVVKGRLRIAELHGVTFVTINDPFLTDAAELGHLRNELVSNLSKPNLRVVLDFKNVQRMSSAAMEMLRVVTVKLGAKGSRLALCRLAPELHFIRESDFLKKVPHFADKNSAVLGKW